MAIGGRQYLLKSCSSSQAFVVTIVAYRCVRPGSVWWVKVGRLLASGYRITSLCFISSDTQMPMFSRVLGPHRQRHGGKTGTVEQSPQPQHRQALGQGCQDAGIFCSRGLHGHCFPAPTLSDLDPSCSSRGQWRCADPSGGSSWQHCLHPWQPAQPLFCQ